MDHYEPNNDNLYNGNNQNPYYRQNQYPQRPAAPKDNLALFSMILGIAGCLTSMIYYISIPCTVSCIVLAVLSRNRIGRFEGKAVIGLCLGISGICLTLFFFAMMLTMLQNPDIVNYMQEYMQTYMPQ